MKIARIPLLPMGANCYVLSNSGSQAVIIDPGGDPSSVVSYMDENKLTPSQVYLTHGHFDHIGGVNALKKRFNIPVYVHRQDSALLSMAPASARYFGIEGIEATAATDYFDTEETIAFGDIDIKIIFTPGHTPGSVCFYVEKMGLVITGDTLFQEGIGRTDLPGGNTKALLFSIFNKLYILPDETSVLSGHGDVSSIGYEATHNPFVRRGMSID